MRVRGRGRTALVLAASFAGLAAGLAAPPVALDRPITPQGGDEAELIRRIDAANQARFEHVQGFTDKEHYAVYRGSNQSSPAAEMTVLTTYRAGVGKNYKVLSRTGSGLIQKFGLQPLLDNEKEINDPAKVKNSWFTSANYEMRAQPEKRQQIDRRDCVAVEIKPKRKAPNMIDWTLWVSEGDGTICEVDGVASEKPSAFSGATHMIRQYRTIDGYAMAMHARAESNGMFGRTVVTIDYSDYHLQLKPGP